MAFPVVRVILEIVDCQVSWAQRVTKEILVLLDREALLAPPVLLAEMVRREIQGLLVMLDHLECLDAPEEREKRDILEEME